MSWLDSPDVDVGWGNTGIKSLEEQASDMIGLDKTITSDMLDSGFTDGVNTGMLESKAADVVGTDKMLDTGFDFAGMAKTAGANLATQAGLSALGINPNSVTGKAASAATNLAMGNPLGAARDGIGALSAAVFGDREGAKKRLAQTTQQNQQMMSNLLAGGGARARSAQAARTLV